MMKYNIKEIDAISYDGKSTELEPDADIKHLNSLSKNEQDEYLKLKKKYYKHKKNMSLADEVLYEFEYEKEFPSHMKSIPPQELNGFGDPPRDADLSDDICKKIEELSNLIKERDSFYEIKKFKIRMKKSGMSKYFQNPW